MFSIIYTYLLHFSKGSLHPNYLEPICHNVSRAASQLPCVGKYTEMSKEQVEREKKADCGESSGML